MTPIEFAETIVKLPIELQNAFFETLKNELSKEDWETVSKFVSIWGMYKNPAKYEAMKNAVCDMLCEEFYGHTVERENRQTDYAANPTYMTTIV